MSTSTVTTEQPARTYPLPPQPLSDWGQIPSSRPPVACEPWCRDGNGHAGDQFPDDQVCHSDGAVVPLSLRPMDLMSDRGEALKWRMAHLDVFLERPATAARPVVGVVAENDVSLRMTTSEATQLAIALLNQAALTEHAEPGPHQADVDAVRGLLDVMENFSDNDQRARYLLSSDWLRDRGAVAGARLGAGR